MLPVRKPETASLALSDGVRLDADVYRPATDGDFPVLLMRQPYGRAIASTLCYAHPAWYAAHGYVVVIQDVRGRGTSQGQFRLFADEARDGAESVAWAAALPGSTGIVGMYGFSYQGMTQLLAAAERPQALKAIAPAMVGWDLRNDWAYENDALCLSAGLSWAVQLAAEGARRAGDTQAFTALFAASRALPVLEATPARPSVLERLGAYDSHWSAWLDEPAGSPYWTAISPAAHADTLVSEGPPALFVSGWYDSHLPGTLAAYRRYAGAGAESRLVIGPWGHFPWGRRVGDADFGEAAISDVDQRQIAWFDRWLKGEAAPASDDPQVRLFDMGARTWNDHSAWPTQGADWSLDGGGRVALDERDGMLTRAASVQDGEDSLVHDPWRAVPAAGGVFSMPAGPTDRNRVDARPDVLTYTSSALAEPLTLAGAPEARLSVTSDSPSFDLSCVLSRVSPDGRSMHVTEGYRHFRTAPASVASVPLRPTCITLAAGERLRLSIAGAAFPNYPVNPGDGGDPTRTPLSQARITTLTLRRGAGASRLMLPELT